MGAHLHRGRSNPRHGHALPVHQAHQIAQREDLRMPRKAEIGGDLEAAGPVRLEPERPSQRMRLDASRPDHVGDADRASAQFNLAVADILDEGARSDVDAEARELALRAGREFRGKRGQDAGSGFDQDDVRPRWIDVLEIPPQHGVGKLGKCAGQFDAGRPSAHHDNGHELYAARRIRFGFRAFKCKQDGPANPQGVVERFETGRMALPVRMSEIAGAAAEGENEVIIPEFAAV